MIILTLVIIAVLSLILYLSYAGVIKARNQLDEALSGIDVQLKKRADLIPNVLKIAQKFMDHEEKIFTTITQLRTEVLKQAVGTAERFATEAELQNAVKQLIVSAENYPQLKSDATMVKAIESYQDVESNIAASRRFYNAALKELKNKVQIFPGSIFKAYAGDVNKFSYFQATAAEKKNVNVDDYLK